MDTFDQMPAAGLCRIHMDPENPVPGLGERITVIRELPDEAIDAFAALAGPDSGSPLLLSELRQLGGALGRPDRDGGALSHLDADFVMYSVGMPMTPELGEAIHGQHLAQLRARRWGPGPPRAATSTSPSAPATSTRSCRPRSAPASPRSSAATTPTA